MRRNETTDEFVTGPRGPESRLDEALKQIRLAEERLDDEALVDDLEDAVGVIEDVRSEVSFTNDEVG